MTTPTTSPGDNRPVVSDSDSPRKAEGITAPKTSDSALASDTGPATFQLGSSWRIADVESLHSELIRLLDTLQDGQRLQIDGSRVERVDAAGAQLLATFAKDAFAKGVELAWHDLTDALTEATRLTGFEALISPQPAT